MKFGLYGTASSIGSIAVVVDPLDDDALKFYKKFGFMNLVESIRMFLTMATIKSLF